MACLSVHKWAASSEFVSSSIPSWKFLTAHAQPFRGTRDLSFCLNVPLDSLLVWASSGGSGETVRMRRLAWTFVARIGDKYQIRLTRRKYCSFDNFKHQTSNLNETFHTLCFMRNFVHKRRLFRIKENFLLITMSSFHIFLYTQLYSNIDIFDNYFLFH